MPDTTPRATGPGITGATETLTNSGNSKRCYNCGKAGHLARDCRIARTESGGARRGWTNYCPGTTNSSNTNQVVTTNAPEEEPDAGVENTLYSCLYHDSPRDVRQVRIQDRGSRPRRVRVGIQGVPTTGVVDSGSDITIMGKDLLKRVAAVARLGRSKLKRADRIPRTYNGLPFTLHGRMDLDISFERNTMRTPIYIKLDTAEQLLLSEGVCRQLGILHYHSSMTTDSQDLHASPRNLSNVAVGSPTPDSQENSPLTVQLGIVGNAGTSHETFVAAGQQTAGGAERNGGGDGPAATTTGSNSPTAATTGETGGNSPAATTTGETGGNSPAATTTGETGGDSPAATTIRETGGDSQAATTTRETGSDSPAATTTGETGDSPAPTTIGSNSPAATTIRETGSNSLLPERLEVTATTTGETGSNSPAATTIGETGGDSPAATTTGETGSHYYRPAATTTRETGDDSPAATTIRGTGSDGPASTTIRETGGDSPTATTIRETGSDSPASTTTGETGGDSPTATTTGSDSPAATTTGETGHEEEATPTARVFLLQSVQLLPGESCFLQVQVEPGPLSHEQFLVECNQTFQSHGTLAISDSLIQLEDSTCKILAVNPSGFTQVLEQGDTLGNAFPVTVETPAVLSGNTSRVLRVNSGSPDRGVEETKVGGGVGRTQLARRRENCVAELPDRPPWRILPGKG